MSQSIVKLQLFGPFKVFLQDGQDVTPSSIRACALLAMLASSNTHERSRRWLEANLWSDRAPEQASGSLRQALMVIRKILPDGPLLLNTNRQTVALAPDVFDIQSLEDISSGGSMEFLEGMCIPDAAFQIWHQDMQSFFRSVKRPVTHDVAGTRQPLTIRCNALPDAKAEENSQNFLIARHSSFQLGQSIIETVGAECLVSKSVGTEKVAKRRADLDLTCNIISGTDDDFLVMDIASCHNQQLLYSGTIKLASTMPLDADLEFQRLSFDAAEAVMEKTAQSLAGEDPRRIARHHQYNAIQDIFRFDRASLLSADHSLDMAYSNEPNPVFLAWKALIRTVQAVELFEPNVNVLQRQAQILIEQCLYEGTNNSVVLSLLALVQVMLFGDEEYAIDLATPALEKNPSNAFALQAMAATRLICGDSKSAYDYSLRSRKIAQGSAFRHWWDLYHCLSCIANERYEEALKMAETAARRSPRFRPPLRQMISLYTYFGETEKAHRAASRLLYLEPGFNIEKFLTNINYPNRTLRNSGLLKLDYDHLRDFSQAAC